MRDSAFRFDSCISEQAARHYDPSKRWQSKNAGGDQMALPEETPVKSRVQILDDESPMKAALESLAKENRSLSS
jgi:hypothetical protein